MNIALANDHAGLEMKVLIRAHLEAKGHQVHDLGAHNGDSVDYPDYARALANQVSKALVDRGILICGTGVGMAITANRQEGIRAAAIYDPHTARMSRSHNNTNVLALGARVTGPDLALAIVDAWLEAPFEGGRHARRLAKIDGTADSE